MNTRTILLATSTLTLLSLSVPALAQNAAPPAAAPAPENGIEEIVVTAERHSQNIMSVPASIQAESGADLNNAGIKTLGDLQFITPGLLPSTSSGYQQLFIRGIGNSVFVGPDPSVATYIDDVPRIWGSMPDTLSDISRVEVLKGAQGGLYGRNATGGVVNIITRQPSTDALTATVQVSYGELNTFDGSAYVNVPITDDLAWSFSAERETHDAYTKNVAVKNEYVASDFTGTGVGVATGMSPAQQAAFLNNFNDPQSGFDTQNTYSSDTKLLYQPTNDLTVTLAGDYYWKGDTNGNQLQLTSPVYTQGYTSGQAGLEGLGFSIPLGPANVKGQPKPGILPPGLVPSTGAFEAAFNTHQFTGLHDWGGSMTVIYNAPFADITSISAYRGQHTDFDVDLGASPVSDGYVSVNNEKQFYYQEVRAVSTGDGPYHWLAGGTFLVDKYAGSTAANLLGFIVSPIVHVDDLIQNWTVYGQAGYDITEQLNLTASIRYLSETNRATYTCCGFTGDEVLNKPEHALIPSATLSYSIPDGNLYVRWARGFKAGGFNEVATPADFTGVSLTNGEEFGPEKVDTYEAGYKQSLMDHRLQITGDIYYNKYNGLQETAHATQAYQDAVILAIANAGSARTYGTEASVNYQVIDPLQIGVNVGYLDAAYSTYIIPKTTPEVLEPQNLSGTEMTNAPKWQLSFTANLDQPISDDFRLVGNLVESHISSTLFDQSDQPCKAGQIANVTCLPNAVAPGYWITNVRLGVRTMDDKYEVAVFANNLFDKAYYTYGASDGNGNDAEWGNPRIVGVQATLNY